MTAHRALRYSRSDVPSVLEISTEGVGCLFSHSNCGEYISDSRVAPSPSCSTTFDYILPETGPIAARQIAFTAVRTNTKRRGVAFAVGYAFSSWDPSHSFLTIMRRRYPFSLTPQTIYDDRRVLNLFQEQCDSCKEASYDRGRRR